MINERENNKGGDILKLQKETPEQVRFLKANLQITPENYWNVQYKLLLQGHKKHLTFLYRTDFAPKPKTFKLMN